ncbi:uncharacterized protein TNIN_345601 [Trichonephila inaurata madagascariensis]|uniref:Uncharacterized protein n=1 Tax=Trichonephila inaurata madagascariensis TaxID=2747483 RepID=A0A8X6XUP9_9ARAC|nr:uncharacterized protein TNIN_345601 [Trichonephila inaurata madagascariensis]
MRLWGSKGIYEAVEKEKHFGDNVFGRCQIPYGTDVDIYRHRLATETLQLLERELARLIAGGYRWAHDYAQCVIQNILYTSRHQISYDPGLCSRLMQFTLPEVPPDILSELESPEPDELAFIKFKPNREDPASDIYADEIFTPPIFSERAAEKLPEKRSLIQGYPDDDWTPNFGSKMILERPEEPSLTDKETLIQELLKTAKDTEKLFEGFQDKAERYPDENLPLIRTDMSSDLTQLPAFTEGGIEWLPAEDENDQEMDELIEPYDKKRVRLTNSVNDHHEEENERRGINNLITLHGSDDVSENDFPSVEEVEEEIPNFGRASPTEDDDSNFQWNTKHRTKMMDDDLTRFAKGEEGVKFMDDDLTRFAKGNELPTRTQIVKSKPTENNELSDVIENDYLEDQLYAILPVNKALPTFTSDKRYDTKKPGPTYMIHEDEDGDTSNDEDNMAMQGSDRLIQALSRKVWQNQNRLQTMFDPPVGAQKPLLPFIRSFEATGKDENLLPS